MNITGGSVPIGLISSNVGGTAVERWSGPDATAQCNQTGVVDQGDLFERFIVPLLPLQMSGWTWCVSVLLSFQSVSGRATSPRILDVDSSSNCIKRHLLPRELVVTVVIVCVISHCDYP